MNKRASFIVAMTIVLVGLPACARHQQHRQSEQASQTWTQEPITSGAEQDYRLEEQRQGAGRDATSRLSTEEPGTLEEPGTESGMEDLDSLDAQLDASGEQRLSEACPMNVEGAEVKSREVPNGVALVFTTDANVEELRTSVDRFAQLHNEQSAAPMPETGRETYGEEPTPGAQQGSQPQARQGGQHEMQHGMVASRAEVEEIDRGAQMILTPRDPNQLSALRQEARREAQQMSAGECPMMGASAPSVSPATGG